MASVHGCRSRSQGHWSLGALDGSLKKVGFRTDPYFGFAVPQAVNGIDSNLLHPELTWSKRDEFRETAVKLVEMFQENFKKFVCRRIDIRRTPGDVERGRRARDTPGRFGLIHSGLL
jgi:ATP-dependent phosphoenolpyruvate carboxykinase